MTLPTATPAPLVLLGFSKPVVGACFALFALLVLKAQLLPIQLPAAGATESYFFLPNGQPHGSSKE
jgi:hypothetical protein